MNKAKLTIIYVIALAVAAKGLGLFRDIIITNKIGFNYVTDAIFIVIPFITLVFSVFNTVIRTSFRPMFASEFIDNPKKTMYNFKVLRNSLAGILFVISIVIFLFPSAVIYVFVPGVDEETANLATKMLKYSIFSLVFIGLVNIYNGFLQSVKVYGSEQYISLINNIIFILGLLFLYDAWGIHAIVFSILVGGLAQYIYIKVKFQFLTPSKDKVLAFDFKYLSKFANENKLIVYGGILSQLTVMVDKFIASFLKEGSITALHYASILNNLPITMVLMIITNIYFTNLSIDFNRDKDSFRKGIIVQTEKLLLFIIPIVVTFILLSSSIVRILFDRGNFESAGINMISSALMAYSIGLLFWSFKDVYMKAFYAAGNKAVPFSITVNSLFLNLIFSVILGYFFGHVGIAMATTISIMVNTFFIIYFFNKKVDKTFGRFQYIYIVKMITIGCILLFSSSFIVSFIQLTIYMDILIKVIIILLIYVVLVKLFKVERGSV
ncbi:lipid II flippase MurJ [Salinicoccus sesuvii]|uniref:Lipid II flippase MurJ n=1 Tax=Salinicoccus sesuvii TaxID=868281 RepID=A0ABV7N7Q6_9STAP